MTTPLINVNKDILSERRIQAVNTVTNGSRYKNAPTCDEGISFIASAQSTYAMPEQKNPRNKSAAMLSADKRSMLFRLSSFSVKGASISDIKRNK